LLDLKNIVFKFEDSRFKDFKFGRLGRFENLVDVLDTLLVGDCLL
jgi:hypothetical protein